MMTAEQKRAYLERLRAYLAPARPETFQHFASAQEKQAHLEQVAQAQHDHKTPF